MSSLPPPMGLFLQCFLNTHRPVLAHASIADIPTDRLGSTTSSQLEASLRVDPSNASACASSARLWESLLEKHRTPFLLLRVADMRYVLESRVTALLLYEELQSQLKDASLEKWIRHVKSALMLQVRKQLRAYKTSSLTSNPSQAWRSIRTKPPTFLHCRLPSQNMHDLLKLWDSVRERSPNAIQAKFVNLICLETNFLEGMFQFRPEIASTLVQVGFLHQAPIFGEDGITGGALRNYTDALSVLRDTRKALNWVFNSRPSTKTLDIETLCNLHETLMHTSRVLNIHSSYTPVSTPTSTSTGSGADKRKARLIYVNVGKTRQTTCINLTGYKLGIKLQFCPHDKVDDELKIFCEQYNDLIRREDIDPFAAAAWIIHAFLMIHPFEDGNSRLSRILASVPLVAKGLPPLCVPYSLKDSYLSLLNSMREDKNDTFHCQELMKHFYEGLKVSLNLLRVV